jgi:hypothetical protein
MICLRSGRRRWTPVRDDERKPGRRFEERSGSLRREKRDKNQKLDTGREKMLEARIYVGLRERTAMNRDLI